MPKTAYKRCSKCGETKAVGEFSRQRSKKDGRQSRCKACNRAELKAWERANPERVAEKSKRYREANPERSRESTRRWKERNPKKVAAQQKRYREQHPGKHRARHMLKNAVRAGRLSKPECCEDCGVLTKPRHLHAHHPDYSKPLEVEWLCRKCHRQRHSRPVADSL